MICKYFHSRESEDADVNWQGIVLSQPEPGWYLVQLFAWTHGGETAQRLVPLGSMVHWYFYPDSETMIDQYEHGSARPKNRGA